MSFTSPLKYYIYYTNNLTYKGIGFDYVKRLIPSTKLFWSYWSFNLSFFKQVYIIQGVNEWCVADISLKQSDEFIFFFFYFFTFDYQLLRKQQLTIQAVWGYVTMTSLLRWTGVTLHYRPSQHSFIALKRGN